MSNIDNRFVAFFMDVFLWRKFRHKKMVFIQKLDYDNIYLRNSYVFERSESDVQIASLYYNFFYQRQIVRFSIFNLSACVLSLNFYFLF